MREIKFRAWDNVLKEHWPNIGNDGWVFGQLLKNTDRYIIEQFTGLKDKNGVEIYEGDIVTQKIEDCVEEKGYYDWQAKVDFMQGCWVVLQLDFDYSRTPFEDLTKLHEECGKVEVVGNVHENQVKP